MAKVYQVWKGNNRFLFGGRLIFGPDWKSLCLSLFLIISPAVLFIVFPGRELVGRLNAAPLVCGIVFIIWDVSLLLLTSSRDPGIVPRNLQPPEPEEDPENPLPHYEVGQRPRLPRTKDVVVNGHTVKVKYCDTCMLYRPPRTSHCSICNNCVEKFDHHCPWVGQCIGRRNYRFFFTFVVSTTLLCVYVFSFSAVNIKLVMRDRHRDGENASVTKAMAASPVSVLLMAYTFLAIFFTGGLSVLHTVFITKNQTTYENFRYRYDSKQNPYNRGCLGNWAEVLCSKTPKSRNNFRAEAPQLGPPRSPPQQILNPLGLTKPAGQVNNFSPESTARQEHGVVTSEDIRTTGHGPGFTPGYRGNQAMVDQNERPKDSVTFTGTPVEGGPLLRRKSEEAEALARGDRRVADNGAAGEGDGFRSARGSESDIVSSFGGSQSGSCSKEASRRESVADLKL